jgi:hypothetical protein
MLRSLLVAFCIALTAMPLRAELSPDEQRLVDALGIPEILAIMSEEGIESGSDLEAEWFPGRGGASWDALLNRIYDVEDMETEMANGLARQLSGTDLEPLLDFFTSERGKRIIAFEVSARQAMRDPDIEAAAIERYTELREAGAERLDLVDTFVTVNDLIESNVMGALNSNFAFYLGLGDGDALPDGLTESEMLSTIWSQEPELRENTEEWVYSYLTMAYQPLSEEDLEAYIAISETQEGRALNRALFGAFDEMYTTISRALGLAASQFIVGQDI